MFVVAAVPLYPPASRVGAWLATHECLEALAERGHRVEVVRYLATGDAYPHDRVTVHGRSEFRRLVASADLLISHLGDDGKAHTVALERGIPTVRMVHGFSDHARERVEGATLAVFNSHASRAEVAWDGPSVVVNPVTWPDRHRTTPGDRVTLVNTSREKGGALLWILSRAMPDTKFLGVRGGYGRPYQQAAKPGNLKVIKATENMRDDVWARTRVLLIPSERESWGMVGVEAMVSGIPVLAHPTAGLVEALGDGATYIDRDNAEAWRLELERLNDPDEWATASARALAHVAGLDPAAQLTAFADAVELAAMTASQPLEDA